MVQSIVLFDGVCNFCNASVNFILARDPRRRFKFAALQSRAGRALLQRFELDRDELDAMILIEGDRCYTRSTALLRVARALPALWPGLYALIVIPSMIRDRLYVWFARNRYRFFGKRETCFVPTPELKNRFLE